MPRERSRWVRRLVVAGAISVALGYIPHHFYGRTGLGRLLRLRSELAAVRRRNESVRAENAHLHIEAMALKGDLRAIERVARDELGLVKSGEIVCQFGEDR